MAKLHLVTVPIGNLEDITSRCKAALIEGKNFFAEDTRNFRQLLQLLSIDQIGKSVDSFHDHSDDLKIKDVITVLERGEDVYLVSDAGSPIISDPGYLLTNEVLSRGFEVETYPGPTSVITALELSGLPPTPFTFHGFFPRETQGQKAVISQIEQSGGTHVFFESPFRLKETLENLTQKFSEGKFAVCREITKKFQTVHRFIGNDSSKEISNIRFQGEFVFLLHVSNKSSTKTIDKELVGMVDEYCRIQKKKTLSKILSKITDRPVKEFYDILADKES